jgi:hypothetical protein
LLIHMCCAALLHCHWQWPTATATAPLFLQHLPCINLLATSPKSTGPVQPQHNKFKRTHRERHPFCGCRTLDPGPRYPRSISASNDASMQRMLLRLKLHGKRWMACAPRAVSLSRCRNSRFIKSKNQSVHDGAARRCRRTVSVNANVEFLWNPHNANNPIHGPLAGCRRWPLCREPLAVRLSGLSGHCRSLMSLHAMHIQHQLLEGLLQALMWRGRNVCHMIQLMSLVTLVCFCCAPEQVVITYKQCGMRHGCLYHVFDAVDPITDTVNPGIEPVQLRCQQRRRLWREVHEARCGRCGCRCKAAAARHDSLASMAGRGNRCSNRGNGGVGHGATNWADWA